MLAWTIEKKKLTSYSNVIHHVKIIIAPHSPRRQKLNLRMKSLSLDSPESSELHGQMRRRYPGPSAHSGHGGSGGHLEHSTPPSNNSRLHCKYWIVFSLHHYTHSKYKEVYKHPCRNILRTMKKKTTYQAFSAHGRNCPLIEFIINQQLHRALRATKENSYTPTVAWRRVQWTYQTK